MKFLLLLQKRILNKKSFLAVLFLIIPVVVGIKICSNQKSGILRIALFQSQSTPMGQQIFDSLKNDIPAFNFIECQDETEAQQLVYNKKADAAWIFDSDFDSRIKKSGSEGRVLPVVTVLQGEDTVFLAYSREILISRIFPLFSYEAYCGFVNERIGSVSQNDLQTWYLRYSDIPELFVHQTQGEQNVSSSYLLSPLRGMLAIWIFICGFAATLYYIDDIEKKRFVWLEGAGKSFGFYLVFVLIPLIDCSIIFLIAVLTGGIFTTLLRELAALLLLILSVAFFVNLLRLITRRKYLFCAAIPLLIILMLVLSPVFLKVNQFVPLQFAFPVFYYLNAIYSTWYLGFFALYTIILAVINIVLMRFRSYNF
jgi:ABC-2 type transport system permease protein